MDTTDVYLHKGPITLVFFRSASIKFKQEDKMWWQCKEITTECRIGPFCLTWGAHSARDAGAAVEVGLFRGLKRRQCLLLTCQVARQQLRKFRPTKASASKQHKCVFSSKGFPSAVAHIGKWEWTFNKQPYYSCVEQCHFFLPERHGNLSRTKGRTAWSRSERLTQISTFKTTNYAAMS